MSKTLDYYNKNAGAFTQGTVDVEFSATQDRFLERLRAGRVVPGIRSDGERGGRVVPGSRSDGERADDLSAALSVLDFGCGSGRDAKYFIDKGLEVTATDGSEELCKLASEYAGIPVRCMLFQELDDVERYDGIWACSSILHLPKDELRPVLKKMTKALKPDGIIYTSFKYGDFEGERNGRYFTDFTEESFAEFMGETFAECNGEITIGSGGETSSERVDESVAGSSGENTDKRTRESISENPAENNIERKRDRNRLKIEEIWTTADVRPGRESERWLNIIMRKCG